MSERDTIAAISTPHGYGGVGMVRVTGPGAATVAAAIFTPLGSPLPEEMEPRKAIVGHVHPPGRPDEPIDQAVLVYYRSPRSYTGEDTVEITAHGGPLIMAGLLEASTLAGARLAEPGEFTRRAFENGRIDLSQAEAVASLIFASTHEARQVMQRQLEGAMGREARKLREGLLDVKIALESVIDFPEDVDDLQPESLVKAVGDIMERAQKLLDTSREGIALSEGLKVVIAGAPNVGKSSLLNALLQEDRAIVHEVAGTTRDFIEGRISIKGMPMVVVDTAGIRHGADHLEGEGISRTRSLMKGADLLLVVLDGSRPLGADEKRLLRETDDARKVVAVNKSDLPRHPAFEEPLGAAGISALTGQGLEALKEAVHDAYTEGGPSLIHTPAVVTTLRQAQALERVREGCRRIREGLMEAREPELIAVDLAEALLGAGELTGEITVEEVLEEIFSRFCIGK